MKKMDPKITENDLESSPENGGENPNRMMKFQPIVGSIWLVGCTFVLIW